MHELVTSRDVEQFSPGQKAVIFKHSTRCPISAAAHSEVEDFAAKHPEVPIYLVKVIQSREASDQVAQRFGIPHESPQVLVFREGDLAWHGSHYEVKAPELEKWI